jgi:general secretion pathway protein F
MAQYTVKVRAKEGLRSLKLTGKTEKDVRTQAERMGKVISVRKHFGMDMGRGLTPAERYSFFNRLASMLSSKVGTSAALALLRDTFTGRIQEVSTRLLGFVESGSDLSQAIEQVGSSDFPEATSALIKAGSKSGETWKALQDAAEFEYELHKVKQGAAKGLWGGVIGFLFAAGTTLASTLYVGPAIMESDLVKGLAEKGGGVDFGTINAAGSFLGWTMAAVLVIALGFISLGTIGRRLFPNEADRVILRIPFYKDLVLAKNNYIVLYGLSLLIRSGVRAEEALRLSAEGAPKGALRTDLFNAMTAVKTGRPWPKVMSTLHPTDKASLMCATDREQIGKTLDTLASQYRTLYGQRLGSFVPALNMVAAVLLSLSGGLLFAQSILPMLMATQGAF